MHWNPAIFESAKSVQGLLYYRNFCSHMEYFYKVNQYVPVLQVLVRYSLFDSRFSTDDIWGAALAGLVLVYRPGLIQNILQVRF